MLLIPSKTKYKRSIKGRIKSSIEPKSCPLYGRFSLKARKTAFITARQIEAARQTITRHLQRQGRVWTCLFPDVGVTKRPTQVRIGKGTGSVKHWVCKVHPGQTLFEIDGVDATKAREALISGGHKLPIDVSLVL